MIELPIVVLGSGGVGKSCLSIQFIQGHFVDRYDSTIEDTYKKPVEIDGVNYVLSIIDTAGQDSFASMRESYMKRGKGFLLVYSITDAESFNQMKKIYAQLRRVREQMDQPYACMIVGNKSDLAGQRAVHRDEGEVFSQVAGKFQEVSAKDRQPTEDIFTTLVRDIVSGGSQPAPPQPVAPPPAATPAAQPTPTPMPPTPNPQPTPMPAQDPTPAPPPPPPPQPQQMQRQQPPPEQLPEEEETKKKKKSRCVML